MARAPWPPAWPLGVGRVVLEEADSTNAEALRRAPEAPTWILALRQTSPRGSRGRSWSTPPGNFAATLALRDRNAPADAARRAFAAGLALHDALAALTGRPGLFALKWPNDLLMEGGKLAGILLDREPVPGAAGAHTLAIGFGVNLAALPDAAALRPGATPPAALAPLVHVAPEALLDALAPAFAARDAQRRQDWDAQRRDWLDRAAQVGRRITARTLREAHEGVFEGLDDFGRLILVTPEGRRHVSSAEVFFEGAA